MDKKTSGKEKHNLPYQAHLDAGRFVVKARDVQVGPLEFVRTTTYVTPRGLEFLRRLLAGAAAA